MAIGTDDIIEKFGTQDPVTAGGGTSAVTNGAMSVTADAAAWTNDDDAPMAAAVLKWQYPSGTIKAGATVVLYARKLNIQSTNDESVPDGSNKVHRLGVFQVDEGLAATTDQYIEIEVSLPNGKTSAEYEFYYWNDTGVSMSAGWQCWVTPKTEGPHG